MIKKYETMFIVKPTLTEEEIKQRVEFIKETLTKNGAEINAVQDMGMRNLAYKIDKFERGYYTVIYFSAKTEVNKELERVFGITEDIIRFNVISYDKKAEIAVWEVMVKKALGLPVEEKKISYASKGDKKPRFDRGERGGDRGGDRKPYNKEYKKRETEDSEGE